MTITNILDDAMDNLQRRKNTVIMEVMREIYARLPYDQEFTLSDGSKCRLKKFVGPRFCTRDGPYHGAGELAFDVVIEGGKLDHLEFFCFNTGGGGMV